MPRKKVEDRVTAKRKTRSKIREPEKKIPPRTHKSNAPAMRDTTPYELPEDVCKRLGHKEIVLAQSAEKKIIVCARLCGLFKVQVPR